MRVATRISTWNEQCCTVHRLVTSDPAWSKLASTFPTVAFPFLRKSWQFCVVFELVVWKCLHVCFADCLNRDSANSAQCPCNSAYCSFVNWIHGGSLGKWKMCFSCWNPVNVWFLYEKVFLFICFLVITNASFISTSQCETPDPLPFAWFQTGCNGEFPKSSVSSASIIR